MERAGILIVGSANMDMVVVADRFPKPGETILGKNFEMFPGGKGANQAVACAKLGIKSYFLGKMGNDEFSKKLSGSMGGEGVDLANLLVDQKNHTGIAVITVDSDGENQIIVISGCNMLLSSEDIDKRAAVFSKVKVVLSQLEIPVETVLHAADLTKKNEAIFILNPAPAINLPDNLFPMIDFLTPNKSELEFFADLEVTDHDSATHAAAELLKKGVKNIIVTLGAEGALLVNREKSEFFPANKVKAVDSTAAGDAFNGALAYSLERGDSIEQAIKFSNYVASLSVMKLGAQSSMPTLDEIKKHNIAS